MTSPLFFDDRLNDIKKQKKAIKGHVRKKENLTLEVKDKYSSPICTCLINPRKKNIGLTAHQKKFTSGMEELKDSFYLSMCKVTIFNASASTS